MGMNVTQKILSAHLASGQLVPGKEIGIRVDQTLTQDATGTMAYLQFESMGLDRVKNELAVSYVDHNTIQVSFENADDHRYLQSVASKFGAIFSKPGNGICHQLHLERFGEPGKILVGSDSHTPTAGALGMFAIGAGGLDVAMGMAGRDFYLIMPKIIKITLAGNLKKWVSAKDIILKVLSLFGTRGNTEYVFEYSGSGLSDLSVPERATIANMGAECGVITSVFPSDELTRSFLQMQGRKQIWRKITADDDADYERVVEINLSEIEPLSAAPHSPGNVVTVSSLSGIKVDQVLIGSCTNSSYRDLTTAALILRGRNVHPDVSLGIACGSRQVLETLVEEKSLSYMLSAGARLLENACGFCIGNSQAPGTNAVSLRTSSRNFKGRSGTPSANVYLVSPEVASVAALHGKIVDPRVCDIRCPRVNKLGRVEIDDSMFIQPSKDTSHVEIMRGPNIIMPPLNSKLSADIIGVATIKVGDNITTDDIMPAGERLKYRSNISTYSKFVFEHIDSDFSDRASRLRNQGVHNLIIAGLSYGQGSSREHAAICPMALGVKAVVAKSIERIHEANLINFGIIPFLFADPDDYERIKQNDQIRITGVRDAIMNGKPVVLYDESAGLTIPITVSLSKRKCEILLAGGLLNYVNLNYSRKA